MNGGPRVTSTNQFPDIDVFRSLYMRMQVIRKAEEQLAKDVRQGRTPGQVHLSDGQEAIAVGVCAHLDDKDQITSTHRGHGHFLAKGGDLKAMFAEIYGKREGICGGMGGSMHVADFAKGIVGANGIVGAGLGIATGAAFANLLDETKQIAVCFFGDGAANQGSMMECLNIASLWNLPILFVCENNGYSEFSPSATVTAGVIADRATPFGIPNLRIDGDDIELVWSVAKDVISDMRNGSGPAFIEAETYRFSGHFSAEEMVLEAPYRSAGEIHERRQRDPILRAKSQLLERGLDEAELLSIASLADRLVEEAVAYGEAGTPPEEGSALQLMFAGRSV